jgi:hypothetical protein
MIADFLRAKKDLVAEEIHSPVHFGGCLGAKGKGGCRGHAQAPGFQQRQHAVLNNFGVSRHRIERRVGEPCQDGVGDVSDPGLDR